MSVGNHVLIARIRARELKMRLVLAVFIFGAAWLAAPSVWPMVWLGAVVLTQMTDWLVYRPLRRASPAALGRGYAMLCRLSVGVSVIVYASISIHLWFDGGETGRLFAILLLAGGLLNVSMHLHHNRTLMVYAALPYACFIVGLPVVEALREQALAPLMVVMAGLLYITHLAVSVRQKNLVARELHIAKRQADEARGVAERANAAKSEFLAVISHEIRTPMNAVISAANLLRRTRLDRDQREHVGMLMDAGDVLMGLLNDVLDFSRIEAGRIELEASEVSLDDRLEALRRLWEPKARENGLRLRVEIDETAPERLRVDALRFQQILFNLISNAVKFTPSGEIVITAAMAGPDRLAVAVRDTGRGIPADRLGRVFDSFEQVEAGDTRRYGGAGLGLAISRRLAELMGGSLTAESEVGRGSVFTLTLPVEAVAVRADAPVAAPVVADLRGRRILAAEDHEVNRRILDLLLTPMGCVLTLVENGSEAVQAAAVEPFDAILMDMQMPVMDGLEATRRIRSGGINAATPILALTANATESHRAAWEAAGVFAFLTKPIDPERLNQALGQATTGPAAADAADRPAA